MILQIDNPHLGKLSTLVIPFALTALDHWSPEVKVCVSRFVFLDRLSVRCCDMTSFAI